MNQTWVAAQQQKHRARAERRKQSTTFVLDLEEARNILASNGMPVTDYQLVTIIDVGVPLLEGGGQLRLDVPAFVANARHILEMNERVDRQTRAEEDEDRAWETLETVYTLDELIAEGYAHEDEKHTLTLLPTGWAKAAELGWEASK